MSEHGWSDPSRRVRGGESLLDVQDRMADAIVSLDRSVGTVLVSHGDAIRAALASLTAVGPHEAPWVDVPNGAVARVDGAIVWLD